MSRDEFVTCALSHKTYLMNGLIRLRYIQPIDAEAVVLETIQHIAQSKGKNYERLEEKYVLRYMCQAVLWKHGNMRRRKMHKIDEKVAFVDLIEQENSSFINKRSAAECAESNDTIQHINQVIDALDERAADIIRMRASDYTLEEIASKWSITRERVRQLETKAHNVMRRKLYLLGIAV